MANPAVATEQRQPAPITGEQLRADAGLTPTAEAFFQVKRYREALGKQGGLKIAERAFNGVSHEQKASYDGTDPEKIGENIRDPEMKKKAIAVAKEAQTAMAAVDVMRLTDPKAQGELFTKLQNEGKLDKGIKGVGDLVDVAAEQIVKNKYYQEWYKLNGYPPGDEVNFAKKFFLAGDMSDAMQAHYSEEIGLLRGEIAELPAVGSSNKEQLDAAQKTADAIKKGAAIAIQAKAESIILNAGGDKAAIDVSVQDQIINAAGIEDKVIRTRKLSTVLAKTAGMTDAELNQIHTYEDNKNELTLLKKDSTKNANRIAVIEPLVTKFEDDVDGQKALSKYNAIQTQVQSAEVQKMTNMYVENTNTELSKRLEYLGADSVTTADSQDEIKRKNAEQNLNNHLDHLTDKVLFTVTKERIDDLSEGAQLDAQDAADAALKKGEKEEALMFARLNGSMAGGKDGIFERKVTTKVGKDGKLEKTTSEILHIDNLEEALAVIAANDTALGLDGTKFMLAYKSGLFSGDVVHKNLAKDVVGGKLSAAEALARLDEKGQGMLAKLCTEEHMGHFRKHIFAEFARAQDYIKAGGLFQDGGKIATLMRHMKGIDVTIDGDASKMSKMTQHWDRILQTHADEVETAIDASQEARALRDRLKAEGWISGDQKKKNILYLLMMLSGMIAFPVVGLAAGAITTGGIGMGATGLIGGAAGKGLADKVVGFSQN